MSRVVSGDSGSDRDRVHERAETSATRGDTNSLVPVLTQFDKCGMTPLSSLEMLTNNPTQYTNRSTSPGSLPNMQTAPIRRKSVDDDSRSRSRSRSRSPASTVSESSHSPRFSPITGTVSSAPDLTIHNRPSPVQVQVPYKYNSCDFKLMTLQRPGSSSALELAQRELLHYPLQLAERESYGQSGTNNGGRFLIAAPIPRKVSCVILPSTSPSDLNNNGHHDKGAASEASSLPKNAPINYSTSRHGDHEDNHGDMSPQTSPSCSRTRSPSPRSLDESSRSSTNEESAMEAKGVAWIPTKTTAATTTNTKSTKLSFGMDRILSQDDNLNSPNKTPVPPALTNNEKDCGRSTPTRIQHDGYSPHDLQLSSSTSHQFMRSLSHQHQHGHGHGHSHMHAMPSQGQGSPSCSPVPRNCSECILLAKLGYKMQFVDGRSVTMHGPPPPTLLGPGSYAVAGYGPLLPGSGLNSPWLQHHQSHPSSSLYDNSTLLSSNGFGHANLPTSYGLGGSNYASMSSMVSCNTNGNGRRKRSWSRAVFSNLQRKGLEKRFQMQKYITKPDRRQLAAMLGLTDAQVKVWFQNRRMKWRHTKEGKSGSALDPTALVHASTAGIGPNVTVGKEKSKSTSGSGPHTNMAFPSGKK